MPDAAPATLMVSPPITAWRLGDGISQMHQARVELTPRLDTLGLHDTPFDPARPIIATGHQAWFWHPGILAKDFASAIACQRLGAQPVHLVVDHIANPALTLDIPARRGDALAVETLRLGPEDLSVGTSHRPPLSQRTLAEAIHRIGSNVQGEIVAELDRLLEIPPGFETLQTLADSVTALQLHAVRAWCPGVFVLRTSQLARLASFQALVSRMLQDARACVAAYNDAVAQVPRAHLAPLLVERDRVELPLWVVEDSGVLGRVFADMADRSPLLTREDGTPIEPVVPEGGIEHLPLAPKALTLTAFMRSTLCDLFIHGTGGGLYEQVTQRWWAQWVGGPLAPLAVVSADVTLGLEVPVATPEGLERAVWYRHHLPYNIDRAVDDPGGLDPALLAQKRRLLSEAGADHDKHAKLAARRRLREINRAFAAQHPGLLADADAAVERARRGVANTTVAAHRGWCFQLYPHESLAALQQKLADSA